MDLMDQLDSMPITDKELVDRLDGFADKWQTRLSTLQSALDSTRNRSDNYYDLYVHWKSRAMRAESQLTKGTFDEGISTVAAFINAVQPEAPSVPHDNGATRDGWELACKEIIDFCMKQLSS